MKNINKKTLQFFSVLADETRLRILVSLVHGPKSVGEIYSFVGKDSMTLSAISHQLKQLDDLEIVGFTKKGREKYFQLSDDFCWCILKDALDHFDNSCKCKCCSKSRDDVRKILK